MEDRELALECNGKSLTESANALTALITSLTVSSFQCAERLREVSLDDGDTEVAYRVVQEYLAGLKRAASEIKVIRTGVNRSARALRNLGWREDDEAW